MEGGPEQYEVRVEGEGDADGEIAAAAAREDVGDNAVGEAVRVLVVFATSLPMRCSVNWLMSPFPLSENRALQQM